MWIYENATCKHADTTQCPVNEPYRPLLPTDPQVTCEWGDGTTEPNELGFHFHNATQFNFTGNDTLIHVAFPHDYPAHNEYNVSCTMWNRVSSMNFSKSVSCLSGC